MRLSMWTPKSKWVNSTWSLWTFVSKLKAQKEFSRLPISLSHRSFRDLSMAWARRVSVLWIRWLRMKKLRTLFCRRSRVEWLLGASFDRSVLTMWTKSCFWRRAGSRGRVGRKGLVVCRRTWLVLGWSKVCGWVAKEWRSWSTLIKCATCDN